MMKTVKAVAKARATAKYVCSPSARNASSGPYAEDESPSAPSPIQARNANRETLWKISGASGSLALPTSKVRSRSVVERARAEPVSLILSTSIEREKAEGSPYLLRYSLSRVSPSSLSKPSTQGLGQSIEDVFAHCE